MWRSFVILAFTGFFTLSGVAAATSGDQIRTPIPLAPESDRAQGTHVIVQRGDHLWKISAKHLGEDSPESDVAPYWRRVVLVNTPRLRSGDPDLIYPGETVELPPVNERP